MSWRRMAETVFGAGMLAVVPAMAVAAPADRHYVGPLASATQINAERLAMRLVADPRIVALRPQLRAIVRALPAAGSPSGAQQIDHSIDEWTMSLAIREICSDTAHPAISWHPENSPHNWFGYTFPGSGIAGDNPDRIYRGTFLDGASTYEVRGSFPSKRSVQFSLEAIRGTPGGIGMTHQSSATPDMGNQIAILEDVNMDVAENGTFVVTIGPESADAGRNHMKLTPGPVNLVVRDTLSDWAEEPTVVEIRRLSGPAAKAPPTEKELVDRLVTDLPEWVRFWANFNTAWLGGLKDNQIKGPAPREGGWGYLAAGRFNLTDQDAIVITTTDQGAKATGFQITNPWMIMPSDARKALLSLNKGQVARNPDGSVTYVLSRRDPGVANWIDTGGLAQGIFIIRWEGVARDADPGAWIRSFQKLRLAGLKGALPPGVPMLGKAERAAQISARESDYNLRLGKKVDPVPTGHPAPAVR